MDIPQAEQWGRAITGLQPRQIGALPLSYPILTDLRMRQTTNDLAPSQADIDLGRIVELLTLNRLMAPQPLYHVADWLAERRFRPILVSDGKMITPEAVLACQRHNLFYLGPLANGTAADAVLRSVSAEELAARPLAYCPQRVKLDDARFVPYQGVWRPFTFEHDGQQVTDRVLVLWSTGKQRLDEEKRKGHLKRLLNKLADIQKKLNWPCWFALFWNGPVAKLVWR